MTAQYSYYEVIYEPPVAFVNLNRPEKKNAMNVPAWTEPVEIFAKIDENPEIKVVILSGKGDCFCAGIDLVSMLPNLPELMTKNQLGEVKWQLLPKLKALQSGISAIEKCRKPVIAAIHGHCIGAGLDMATACDIRISTQDAVFNLKEAAIGFVADVGVLQRIPLIVGQGIARELAFTASDLSGERAKEILLVNRLFPDYETLMKGAKALAHTIAGNPTIAVQATKDVLNYCVGKSVADGLHYVAAISSNIIPSLDLFQAMEQFSKRDRKNS